MPNAMCLTRFLFYYITTQKGEKMKFDTVTTEDFEPPSIGVMPVSHETKALLSKTKVTTLRRIYSSPKFKTGQKTTIFRKKFFPEVSSWCVFALKGGRAHTFVLLFYRTIMQFLRAVAM